MKNLMTFVAPNKDFNDECKELVKIQIENSFDMGWGPEDIVLATNFDYEYMGVKSLRVCSCAYCDFLPPTTKIWVIVDMFESELVEEGEMYWYHDFDTYQLYPITEEELGMEEHDMGIANYGRRPRLCSASMFFKKSAADIFQAIKDRVLLDRKDEEVSVMRVINENMDTLGKRVKKLNPTYAYHRFNILTCYPTTTKPLRAAHFHLTPDKIDFYMHGQNKLNMCLLPDSLISILNKYGYR